MAKPKLTALGGDIFAGLFTVGVKRAGFEVLGHLEHTTYGTKTAKLNFPNLEIRNGVHTWNPHEYTGKVDFMYTNPPCAAWSAMQVSTPWQEHTERLQIIRDLTAAGLIIKPKAWVWESVMGAWRRGKEFILEEAEKWLAHGYHVTVLLQNNMHLGVSQNRPRVLVIAHQYPLIWPKFIEPQTTRQLLASMPKGLGKSPVKEPPLPDSLKQLWGECENMGYTLRRALVTKTAAEQAKLKPRPAMTVNRMKLDDVPGTFIGASKRLHPKIARNLNWFECLALAGLPMDWKTSQKSLEPASLELSRAVMPAVGEWLGTAVKNGLKKAPLDPKRPVCRLVDLRDPENIHEEVLMTFVPPKKPPVVEWNPVVPEPKLTRSGEPRTPRAPRDGRPGSGQRMRELLEQGLDTQGVLEVIHKEFPESTAGPSDVSWNRRKLRQLKGEK